MQCPVCKSVRLAPGQVEEGLGGHSCPSCGGQYVRSEQYFKWLQRHGENLPERRADASANLPVRDSSPGKLCPECGAFLIRHAVGHGAAFHLDRCGRCGGLWFDRDEWDALKARNLHDDVHYVFSEAWQADVKRHERTDGYRKLVGDILDDKLRAHVGEADLARLKELKAWIDAHPGREEMYAYLASARDV